MAKKQKKAVVVEVKKAASDKNYKMKKATKNILSSTLLTKAERLAWKRALISADLSKGERFVMNYDVKVQK